MGKALLECCIDSVESAVTAARAGADRLEVCSSLVTGGLTPTLAMFKLIKKYTDNIKYHILIRPRFGDFCYSDYEYAVMEEEVLAFKEAGADGVVIGGLTPDGRVNKPKMASLVTAAGDIKKVFHRAFDVSLDPISSLEELIALNFDGVLTSGAAASCVLGLDTLESLYARSKGRIEIIVGAGVNAENIPVLRRKISFNNFHMSGNIIKDSRMTFRRDGVPMGLDSLSEFSIYSADYDKIHQARLTLDSLEQT